MATATKRLKFIIMLLFLGVSLWARLGGLSHGLSDGIVYHPDTPKQAFATQRFLQGQYFIHIGNPDYDGYPYFSSLLAELLFRSVIPAINGLASHAGLSMHLQPDQVTILWVMRLLNVVLSLGIVGMAYALGKLVFDRNVGLLAAAFTALSPLAIIACHYGMSDTPVAFFAIVSVYFCIQIYRHGRLRDYAAAALFAAFSFAAKYHGGMVIFACATAHLLRCGGVRQFFSREAWRCVGVAGLFAVIGLVIATPAMWVEPDQALKDLVDFFGRVSTFGMDFLSEMNLFQRMLFALGHNRESIFTALSPAGALLLIAGIALLPKCRRENWILAALPMGYVFVGLTLKPLSDPQYHSVATHILFVLMAAFLVQLARIRRGRIVLVPLSVLMTAAILVGLFRVDAEQVFFFKTTDTRLLVTQWHKENVPPEFAVHADRYSILAEGHKPGVGGAAYYKMGPGEPDEPPALTYLFDMGDTQFTIFRNPPVSVTIPGGELIQPGWKMPVFNLVPSMQPHNVVFADQPAFVRSSRVRVVEPYQPQRFVLMQREPLTNLWAVVRCGRLPSLLEMQVGEKQKTLTLAPFETTSVSFSDLRPSRITDGGHHAYNTELNASMERVRVHLCTTPDTYGAALFNAGLHEEAAQVLARADMTNPTLKSMAAVSSGSAEGDGDDVDIATRYGIAPSFIEGLPAVEFARKDVVYEASAIAGVGQFASPPMMLEKGAYSLELKLAPGVSVGSAPPLAVVDDRTRRHLHVYDVEQRGAGASNGIFRCAFEMPGDVNACRILINKAVSPDDIVSMSCRIRASDTVAMLRRPVRVEAAAPESMNPCHVTFAKGIALEGWRMGPYPELAAGAKATLHLYWCATRPSRFLHEVGVWVHFEDAGGRTVFQGDRSLSADLPLRPEDGIVEGLGADLTVPASVPPGDYTVRVGLYIPMQSKRLKIRETELPHRRNGAAIGTVRVVPAG
jgi:hypothetical protein